MHSTHHPSTNIFACRNHIGDLLRFDSLRNRSRPLYRRNTKGSKSKRIRSVRCASSVQFYVNRLSIMLGSHWKGGVVKVSKLKKVYFLSYYYDMYGVDVQRSIFLHNELPVILYLVCDEAKRVMNIIYNFLY